MLASIFSVTIRWFSRIIEGLKNGCVCHSCWRIAMVDNEELQSSNAIKPAFQISSIAAGELGIRERGVRDFISVVASLLEHETEWLMTSVSALMLRCNIYFFAHNLCY